MRPAGRAGRGRLAGRKRDEDKEELTPEDLRTLPVSKEIVSLISQVLNSAELP
jgi:hypothetical protein